MEPISFEGRVAVVTGAGAGVGRSYAHLLAERGARVVVNDLGGGTTGVGSGTQAAEGVVREIVSGGGEAVADFNTVLDGAAVIETATAAYGRVDVLINNAGILRPNTFDRQAQEDWDLLLDVHLNGTRNMTKAAWPIMRQQGYGRIVNTSSSAGLYGTPASSDYGAAKAGVAGLSNCLRLEGARHNIKINTIAPVAGTRMTEAVDLPTEWQEALKPELVAPLVAYLSSEHCQDSGYIYSVGGGCYSRIACFEGVGVLLDEGDGVTIEDVAAHMDEINDMSGASEMNEMMDQLSKIVTVMGLAPGTRWA